MSFCANRIASPNNRSRFAPAASAFGMSGHVRMRFALPNPSTLSLPERMNGMALGIESNISCT